MAQQTPAQTPLRPVFPGGGMKSRITRLVFASVLLTVLSVSAVGLYAVYASVLAHVHDTHPLALRWSGQWLQERLEQAGSELEAVAREEKLQAWVRGFAGAGTGAVPIESLSDAIARSATFEALLLLDGEGEVLAAAGFGPALAGMRERLRPKSSLDAELVEVMRTAQLRKDLGSVAASSMRVVDPGEVPPLPLASAPLRDARGRKLASLHGLVRREELASRLRADLIGASGNVLLVDEDGRILAAGAERSEGSPAVLAPAFFGTGSGEEPRRVVSASQGWVLTSAHPVGIHAWTLVAVQPLCAAFGPLLLAALGFALVGLALVLLCTVRASRLAGATVRPLWALLQGIREASKGRVRHQVSSDDAWAESEALITAFNAMVGRLGTKSREIEESHRALQEQHEAFQQHLETVSKLSITDTLTKLHNRRYFDTELQREIKRTGRSGQGISLLIIDIDHFKQLNDRYGHAAGDEFLKQVARILREIVRETDLLARFGGEEFVVVATQTTVQGATILAEKIRTAVAEASFIVDDTMRPRKATISIGVAEYRGSKTDLFNSADAALYRAKESGRNCVMVAGVDDVGLEPGGG